ncbi:polymerase, partial [Pandoraea pneumonica]
GGWIVLPVLLVVWLLWRNQPLSVARRVTVGVFALVLLAATFSSHVLRDRFEMIRTDLVSLSAGNPNTSTGIRVELW